MQRPFTRALGDGVLPMARGVLYRCPERTRTTIKVITLVNACDYDTILNLYLNASGNPRRILTRDIIVKRYRLMETDGEYALEPGDTIEADCERANAVEYTISGIETT
jgi:hypothetical protein